MQICASVKHPNVLPLLGFVRDEHELPGLVNTWIENGDIMHCIGRGFELDIIRTVS